jgi:hypothetical protein
VRRRRLLAALIAGVVAIAACGPTTPTPSPSRSAAAPSVPASPVESALSASPSSVAGAVRVDPTLLDLLPRDVGGVPLAADQETAAEIAADRALAGSVTDVAVATAFGPLSTAPDTAADYVVVTLARLKPSLFSVVFFRGWRDSFDAAVCAQAGGIDGHAEADINGHETFITSCAGGVRTYHVHLPSSDVIVSMQALGEGRFGERVVEGLTE